MVCDMVNGSLRIRKNRKEMFDFLNTMIKL